MDYNLQGYKTIVEFSSNTQNNPNSYLYWEKVIVIPIPNQVIKDVWCEEHYETDYYPWRYQGPSRIFIKYPKQSRMIPSMGEGHCCTHNKKIVV